MRLLYVIVFMELGTKRTRLTEQEALQAAYFLARSPAHLGIGAHESIPLITPNEQYVTLNGFEDLKGMTRHRCSNFGQLAIWTRSLFSHIGCAT